MKENTLRWRYADGTIYRVEDNYPLAGCEDHINEQYHFSHTEAVKWINDYCTRLSDEATTVWQYEIK